MQTSLFAGRFGSGSPSTKEPERAKADRPTDGHVRIRLKAARAVSGDPNIVKVWTASNKTLVLHLQDLIT